MFLNLSKYLWHLKKYSKPNSYSLRIVIDESCLKVLAIFLGAVAPSSLRMKTVRPQEYSILSFYLIIFFQYYAVTFRSK